jgi:hypothetical protein
MTFHEQDTARINAGKRLRVAGNPLWKAGSFKQPYIAGHNSSLVE